MKPSCFTVRQIVARLADVPKATCSSARVRSGLLADQRRERVQLGGAHRMPPVPLLARGDFAGLAPPVFEPPDPGGTDVVFARDGGRVHAGIAIAEDAFAMIHIE